MGVAVVFNVIFSFLFFFATNAVFSSSISPNVKLKVFGVLQRDINVTRRFPSPAVTWHNSRDYDMTNLIVTKPQKSPMNVERLFCDDINDVSYLSKDHSESNALIRDLLGNQYELHQFGVSDKENSQSRCLCAIKKSRRKRQFDSIVPRLNDSNVIVNSPSSNITVTQLINITSAQSIVEIRENGVRMRINTERSNVRINPKDNFVNISVATPYVVLNTSDRQSVEMTSVQSEFFVVTQKNNQNYSIVGESGPSNFSLRQGSAFIQALADTRSKVTVQSFSTAKDQILINSRVIDQATFTRELTIFAMTQNVRTEIQLVRGLVLIIYDKVQIRVSAVDHEILIHTDVYNVRITTLLSPFNISVADVVDVGVDNARVLVFPDSSNVTGYIPYSLMQLRTDNATNVQLQTEQQGVSALANANIDVESGNLTLEVVPKVPRIYALSLDSYAVINTSFSNVGLRANRSIIEVLSGNPYIRVLTGNTSIEVRAGGQPFTFPPFIGSSIVIPTVPVVIPTNPTPVVIPTNPTQVSITAQTQSTQSLGTSANQSSASTAQSATGQTVSSGLTVSTAPSVTVQNVSNTISIVTPPLFNTSGTAQTPNISSQGEGGTSVSPVDHTNIIPLNSTSSNGSFTNTLSSVVNDSSSATPSGATGSLSPVTATNTVLSSTVSLPDNSSFSSSSSSSSLVTVSPSVTQTSTNKSANIYPFPFPVVIPWPIPVRTTSSAVESSSVTSSNVIRSVGTESNIASSGNTVTGNTISGTGITVTETNTQSTGAGATGSEISSGATVSNSHSCVTNSLNSSSDIVCIEAEIVSIQVPPMNSSSETVVPTLAPTVNATERFVIIQFSNGSSVSPSITLPLPITAENSSLTSSGTFPTPPTFGTILTASPLLSNPLTEVVNTPGAANFLQAPPNEAFMLEVGFKVKRSADTSSTNFTQHIQKALQNAYIEGRNRQLGIRRRQISKRNVEQRFRRLITVAPTNDFDKVAIRVVSVDRPETEDAKVKFFVMNDNSLIEAKKAKEAFDQLDKSELSTLLAFNVTDSVKPVSISDNAITNGPLPVELSDSRVIVSIIVTIGALFLIGIVCCFAIYKFKKKQAKNLVRKTSNVSGHSEVIESGNSKFQTPKGVVIEANTGDEVYQKKMLLGDLPPLPTGNTKLIKNLDDKDLLSYDKMSYTELFEYVNPTDKAAMLSDKRVKSPIGNKVAPLNSDNPNQIFSKWDASHSKPPPPTSQSTTQVVRISPISRRRIAKDLLDNSFPLVNVNVDEVITGGRY